jgi:predicted amidohydrolase YtcJ
LLEESVTRVAPCLTREQKKNSLLTAMKELNSLGITSITEGALGPGGTGYQGGLWDAEYIDIYNDLYNKGRLTLRVSIMMLFTRYGAYSPEALYEGLPRLVKNSSFGSDRVRMGGIKLFADGIPLNKTAWMYDEYVGGGNSRIIFSGETDEARCQELIKIVAYSHKLGFRLGIHVTGDRAIDACIDSFIRAEQEEPKGLRHYLIHGDFVSAEAARRMAEYNIGVSAQPALADIVMNFLPHTVGTERAARYGCLRTMLDAGVHVAGGSDAPVTYPDWKTAIQSIVLRDYMLEDKSARHVTVEEAIRMYTVEGAWQDHMEDKKGSIEEGKLADFCVLDEDILTVEPHRIKDIRNLMTIVGGEIVYDAGLSD